MIVEKVRSHYSIKLFDVEVNQHIHQIVCFLKLCWINVAFNRNKLLQLYFDTYNQLIRLAHSCRFDDEDIRKNNYATFNSMRRNYFTIGLTLTGEINKPTTWRKDMLHYSITEMQETIDYLNNKYSFSYKSEVK